MISLSNSDADRQACQAFITRRAQEGAVNFRSCYKKFFFFINVLQPIVIYFILSSFFSLSLSPSINLYLFDSNNFLLLIQKKYIICTQMLKGLKVRKANAQEGTAQDEKLISKCVCVCLCKRFIETETFLLYFLKRNHSKIYREMAQR